MNDIEQPIDMDAIKKAEELGAIFSDDYKTLVSFENTKDSNEFTIPDGVTSIGDEAFNECTWLTSIRIPSSVTNICKDPFCNSDIKNIYVDKLNKNYASVDGVLYSKDFSELIRCPCAKTEYRTPCGLYDKVISVGNDAFNNCTLITKISLPKSITHIGYEAFSFCMSLTNISLPPNVKTIKEHAFSFCINLSNIAIPPKVTTIEDGIFWECKNLTNIVIHKKVKNICGHPFIGCTKLESISIDGDNKHYTLLDGVLYSKDFSKLVRFLCCHNDCYTVPPLVTKIDDYAFWGSRNLIKISISKNVKKISKQSYIGCNNNISVDKENKNYASMDGVLYSKDFSRLIRCPYSKTNCMLPDTVVEISSYAFSCCYGLTSITIPESVASIGDYAFRLCGSLESISIPEGVTSIGNKAFYCCENLTSITIPKCVTSIGEGVFYGCDNLTVYLEEGSELSDEDFYKKADLSRICKIIRTKFKNGQPVII